MRDKPFTVEEALDIVKLGGTLQHEWLPDPEASAGWDMPAVKHNPECKWCKAIKMLEWLVEERRSRLAEEALNSSR